MFIAERVAKSSLIKVLLGDATAYQTQAFEFLGLNRFVTQCNKASLHRQHQMQH